MLAALMVLAVHTDVLVQPEGLKDYRLYKPITIKQMKISKKTTYNIKEASNPKLKASARKHYAENAQAAIKSTIKNKTKKK